MKYQTPLSNLPNLKYGREMEERARKNYYALSWSLSFEFCDHENWSTHQYQLPPSASPDGIIDFDCCGKGLVETKCPRKYSADLKGWENDKNFAIDSSKDVK